MKTIKRQPRFNLITEGIKLALYARQTGFDDRAYYTKKEAIRKAVTSEKK